MTDSRKGLSITRFLSRDKANPLTLGELSRAISSQQAAMRHATKAASNRAHKEQFAALLKETGQTVKRLQGIVAHTARIERTENYRRMQTAINRANSSQQPLEVPAEEIESFTRLNLLISKAYRTLQESVTLMRAMAMDMEATNLTSAMRGDTTQFTIDRLKKNSAQLRTMAESLDDLYE